MSIYLPPVSGLWSLVSGLWSLVSGLWSLVSNKAIEVLLKRISPQQTTIITRAQDKVDFLFSAK